MQVVVMAAGMGSRFGGLKQMEKIDEFGNFILDYSIVDAKEAGFDEVVFIIKHSFYEEFDKTIGERARQIIKVKYAFQELENIPAQFSVPAGRIKPWGTGHAVLAAKKLITGPFIIINGDDYYGKETFKVAYEFLSQLTPRSKGKYANVAFEVANTMTENGAVKRGVCFENNGLLTRLIESSVEAQGDKVLATPLDVQIKPFLIERNTPVSMNLFCFTKDFMKVLDERFVTFLRKEGNQLKSEYLIPDIVSQMVTEDKCQVRLLSSPSVWYGITYKEDTEKVFNALKDLRDKGVYKKELYK